LIISKIKKSYISNLVELGFDRGDDTIHQTSTNSTPSFEPIKAKERSLAMDLS